MEFLDVEMPRDTTPAVSDIEYPCEECGKEAGPYVGRGRKPKRCPDHKRNQSTRVAGKGMGQNATLAAQAAEALVQLNSMLAVGAMLAKMPATASMIAATEDGFREQATNALLTDPDLCRTILRAGVKSAKLSLGIAYAMAFGAVMPVAVMELKERAAAREERKRVAEDEANASGAANT